MLQSFVIAKEQSASAAGPPPTSPGRRLSCNQFER